MAGMRRDDEDGELIKAHEMLAALTSGTLVYSNGANQAFAADGQRTTYVERGLSTQGTWEILGDGNFSVFWPPDFHATYLVRWIIQQGVRIGISFTDAHSGSRIDGLYR